MDIGFGEIIMQIIFKIFKRLFMKKLCLLTCLSLIFPFTYAQNALSNIQISSFSDIYFNIYTNFYMKDIVKNVVSAPSTYTLSYAFGYKFDIKKQWEFAIQGEFGGYTSSSKSWGLTGACALFAGYSLKKIGNLTIGFKGGMNAYQYYATNNTPNSFDIKKPYLLGNANTLTLNNTQLMIGPYIKYPINDMHILFGMDFGLVPTEYQSSTHIIENNEKTTYNKIYIGYSIHW